MDTYSKEIIDYLLYIGIYLKLHYQILMIYIFLF